METDDGKDCEERAPEQTPPGPAIAPPDEFVEPALVTPAPESILASSSPAESAPMLLLLGRPTTEPEAVAPRPATLIPESTLESTLALLTAALMPPAGSPEAQAAPEAPPLLLAPPIELYDPELPDPEIEASTADPEAPAVLDEALEEPAYAASAYAPSAHVPSVVAPDAADLELTAAASEAEVSATALGNETEAPPAAPAPVSDDFVELGALELADMHAADEPDLPTESATVTEPSLVAPEPTTPRWVSNRPLFGAVQWPRLERQPDVPAPALPPVVPEPKVEPEPLPRAESNVEPEVEREPPVPDEDYRVPELAPTQPLRPEITSTPALIASVLTDITSALTSPALPTRERTTPTALPAWPPLAPPPAPFPTDTGTPIPVVPAPAPARRAPTAAPVTGRQTRGHGTRALAPRRLALWALAIKGVFVAVELPVVLVLAIYAGVMPLLPASPPIARVLASGQSGAVLARQSTYCWFTPGNGRCVTPTAAPEQSLPVVSVRKGSVLQVSFSYPAPTACAAAIPDGESTQDVMKPLGSLHARDNGGAFPARTFQVPISLAPGTYRLNVSCVWRPLQSLRWLQGQGESAYWVGLRILPG
jgi:hypothetical protein